MNQKYWSYEDYRKLLSDLPEEHLWGVVRHDLRNPFASLSVELELLYEDTHNDSIDVKEILETLLEVKISLQKLVNVISAVEAHIIDTHKSDNLT
jgi:hypothetical protein